MVVTDQRPYTIFLTGQKMGVMLLQGPLQAVPPTVNPSMRSVG